MYLLQYLVTRPDSSGERSNFFGQAFSLKCYVASCHLPFLNCKNLGKGLCKFSNPNSFPKFRNPGSSPPDVTDGVGKKLNSGEKFSSQVDSQFSFFPP